MRRVRLWKENKGTNQIVIKGDKVKVNVEYTTDERKTKKADYTGKISYKKSTPYKIAIVHGGKVDYIEVSQIFKSGEIFYEVYDSGWPDESTLSA